MAGVLASKALSINDSTTYTNSVRTNFRDYTWLQKLRIELNKNVAFAFKVVPFFH